MRIINKIIIHCSASSDPKDDNFERLVDFHTSPKTKKFKWGDYDTYGKDFDDCGYHYFITKDGTLYLGRPLHIAGAHCRGHNLDSIGICFSGDGELTESQIRTGKMILGDLKYELGILSENIYPHNHFNKTKTCPNFDIEEVLKESKI